MPICNGSDVHLNHNSAYFSVSHVGLFCVINLRRWALVINYSSQLVDDSPPGTWKTIAQQPVHHLTVGLWPSLEKSNKGLCNHPVEYFYWDKCGFIITFACQEKHKKQTSLFLGIDPPGWFPKKTQAKNSNTQVPTRPSRTGQMLCVRFCCNINDLYHIYRTAKCFNSVLRLRELEQIRFLPELRAVWLGESCFGRRQEDNGLIRGERRGSLIRLLVFRKSPAGSKQSHQDHQQHRPIPLIRHHP